MASNGGEAHGESGRGREYLVVARRYRPAAFEELVGQEQAARALQNAITTGRVGHAYLFTGARGVGKTSTARILAKALNCASGPTPRPCNRCEMCESIAVGEDVDVLEIDGASNRGIDEIRQLRSNAGVRPSRSRFKIYIIDEVHMLTSQAFNALLKTLEEPPEHVKFIFCTTDPEKIPVTVLSRCQRFDFAPLETTAILERLRRIVQSEGMEADQDALQLLARRAGGSMRDGESLLEQLMAFQGERITAGDVHAMLGTAPAGRLAVLTRYLTARDAAAALRELDEAIDGGVDAGQLGEQLLGYFRDVMAAAVGCRSELMLHTADDDFPAVAAVGEQFGLETTLAVLQILDEALVRMRHSGHSRTVLEAALVRICRLDDLDQLAEVLARLERGAAAAGPAVQRQPSAPSGAAAKKNPHPAASPAGGAPMENPKSLELTAETAVAVWKQALALLEDMTADFASYYEHVATPAPDRLVVAFRPGYTHHKESCERPDRKAKIEAAVSRLCGRPVRVDFEAASQAPPPAELPRPTRRQRLREMENHPLVRQAIELFDGELIRLEDGPGFGPSSRPTTDPESEE
jgi:DNA polymerase-3 subunit gamma/tau